MAKVNNLEILLGCDPEVFVVDKETGKFASAFGLIPGTKAEPMVVKDGMVQVDGMALEFGITPATTKKQFINRIKSVVGTLQDLLPDKYQLAFTPIAEFPPEVIAAQPPEALELGCDPDWNAYSMTHNPKPRLVNPNLRSAGGHVHIGWGADFPIFNLDHVKTCGVITQELDAFLGIPSLSWDSNELRRTLYGKAGAFRPKPYGMEYRTLSNQWLLQEETIEFVYDYTIAAVKEVLGGYRKGISKKKYFLGKLNLNSAEVINQGWTRIGREVYKGLMAA